MGQQLTISQPSFAAGELSPDLHGRTDLNKYRVGAALLHNVFVKPYGGAATRPGTAIVGRCKQPYGTPPRDIDFIYNTVQAYVLEFGNLYMRVVMNGGYVLEPSVALAGVTIATPGVFNFAAHGWSVGDQVFISGALGMTGINSTAGYQYLVASVPDANHVTFTDLDGNSVSTAAMAAYTGGGVGARIFTLVTPYAVADLPLIKYTQSADTLTITHPSYAPRDITRTQHWAWTLTTETFAALVQPPTGLTLGALNPGAVGGSNLDYRYVVTAVTDSPIEESIPTAAATITNKPLNQGTGTTNNTIQNSISWTAPVTGPAPARYNIYSARPVATGQPVQTVFGYIGQSTGLTFTDTNIDPDYTQGPPQHLNPFAGSVFPACCTYDQARRVYGGPNALPEAIYFSQSGNFANMDTHSPVEPSDAITVSLTSRQVNAIKHLVSMNSLIALTSSGAWQISGGSQSDAITPTTIAAKAQAYNGCSDVPPLPINTDIFYVQARGAKVRDLSYNFYVNLYTGNDMSVLSNHLFFGYTIREWCYAEEPFYQISAVRSDGVMLAFTVLKEQEVFAWSHYDTPGNSGTDTFISVASIPEGNENAVYCVTARTVPGVNGGAPVYYQERFASRNFYTNGVADITKAWCVDCGIKYSGVATSTITGLEHLNGCTVAVVGDGSVQAPQVVANGQITLAQPASVVYVGLPYVCDWQTLRLDTGEPSVQGKRKKITRVSLLVEAARGLSISPARLDVSGNLVFDQYVEMKERSPAMIMGSATPLRNGVETILIKPQWQVDGVIAIRQAYPLPATVLAVVPTITFGDDNG